jgi:peptidoglycan/LPS O-acetylase OafA/YrhL
MPGPCGTPAVSTSETAPDRDWSFPQSEARATAVLAVLLPVGAGVVFAGFTGDGDRPPYVVATFLATFAIGVCLAVLVGRAQRRMGRSPWRGGTWEDFRALQAAAKQCGWPSTPILIAMVIANGAAIFAFVNTLRSVGSG